MFNIRDMAVQPTGRLHLKDSNDELMYAKFDEEGNPIIESAVAAIIYGPGSKQYVKAHHKIQQATMGRITKKGKLEVSVDDAAAEKAELLTAITKEWENMAFDEITSHEHMSMAIYSTSDIGFIADQVSKYSGEWGNFSKPSVKS
jgi:hypothetical protein